jgi:hypothetical protein
VRLAVRVLVALSLIAGIFLFGFFLGKSQKSCDTPPFISAADVAAQLALVKQPAGDYLTTTWQSDIFLNASSLPERFNTSSDSDGRYASSLIYHLLVGNSVVPLHYLDSDEIWAYYGGSSVLVYEFDVANGAVRELCVGVQLERGCVPQYIARHNTFIGAVVDGDQRDQQRWTLTGAQLVPAFDARDSHPADRALMVALFPAYRDLIIQLTPQN